MICQKCGTENVVGAKFCAKCGTVLTAQEPVSTASPHVENVEQTQSAPQSKASSTEPVQNAGQPQELPIKPLQNVDQPQVSHQQVPQTHQQPFQGFQQQPNTNSQPPQNFQQPPPGYPPHGSFPPQDGYPPHGAYQQPAQPGFVSDVFSKAFGFLFNKPLLLWGLSLLGSLLALLAIVFSVLPIIWFPILLVLQLGLVNIFLCGYRGQNINSNQLFEGFKKGKFLRNAGGMGWMSLWVCIWAMIPFVGIVISIIKYYSYRFVPYILLSDPDISATDALKKSMVQTSGYRGKMFLVDIIVWGVYIILTIIFSLIMRIPYIGPILFWLYSIAAIALMPLLVGIIEAVVYDKVSKERPM
ncbi:MAG: zinc-ribbon domain-containing protein [Defluviitaleaceae bacterium]|nr:zinc-ribbon domain-containing protein [Defluviitaleaceae bacterium]